MARKAGTTKTATVAATGTICPKAECEEASDPRSSQKGYCSEHFQAGQASFLAKTAQRYAGTFGRDSAEKVLTEALAEAPKAVKVNAQKVLADTAKGLGISPEALKAILAGAK